MPVEIDVEIPFEVGDWVKLKDNVDNQRHFFDHEPWLKDRVFVVRSTCSTKYIDNGVSCYGLMDAGLIYSHRFKRVPMPEMGPEYSNPVEVNFGTRIETRDVVWNPLPQEGFSGSFVDFKAEYVMRESEFEREICKGLEACGAIAYKLPGGAVSSGLPDRFVAHRDWHGFVEFKSIKGEVRKNQELVLRGLAQRGVNAVVVWPGVAGQCDHLAGIYCADVGSMMFRFTDARSFLDSLIAICT